MTKKLSTKAKKSDLFLNEEYSKTLADLKHHIQEAQLKAVVSVNRELIRLYWHIGKTISVKERQGGWGAKIISKLSEDLGSTFPNMKGFSPRNLLYMRQFADAYPDFEITQQAVAQIPWGHNVLLLTKIKDSAERLWYANKTIDNGWSRSMLIKGLIDHVQKLLSEFGRGFAFVGRQCRLEIDGKEFAIDLLFYHIHLHCYVIAELKTEEFQPEFAGKMNFYLEAELEKD